MLTVKRKYSVLTNIPAMRPRSRLRFVPFLEFDTNTLAMAEILNVQRLALYPKFRMDKLSDTRTAKLKRLGIGLCLVVCLFWVFWVARLYTIQNIYAIIR